MAPDGDYVTDYSADTVEGVEEALADRGSRWVFYPFAVVVEGGKVSDESRIVSGEDFFGDGFEVFGGEYEGQALDSFRRDVVAVCERARLRLTCPKCHGAGRVSPEVVA